MNRNRWILLGSVVAVVLTIVFLAFRPDKLFVDEVVDEDLDAGVAAAVRAAEDTDGASSLPSTSSAPGGDTTPPTTAAPTTTLPQVLGQGDFVAQTGHDVVGSAFVVDRPEGRLLVLPELDSENGPDLQLYRSPAAEGSVDGGVYIAPLEGNQGTQSYELADGIDLALQRNVVIWCDRFDVPFGTATLR